MIAGIKEYWNDFVSLLYPHSCPTCGKALIKSERWLCTACLLDIPLSDYWKFRDNPVNQLFWGRTPIEFASAFMIFSKGSAYRKLIHRLKYQGDKESGIQLGEMYGKEIAQNSKYEPIDLIIPVPLHPKKQKKRGYNQSECIAIGLSKSLSVPYRTNILVRTVNTQTQTKKNKEERWKNVSGTFKLAQPKVVENKHILLVDDVITTGATIENCAITLLESANCKISIACLARA